MATISVVINTYNAAATLRRCVEAASGYDEVLVCDMESTDGTRELAESLGCRVVVFPKGDCNIVEPAREFALKSASSDYALVVDADEIVTPQLREYLYKRVSEKGCPAGIFIPRMNHMFGTFLKASYPDYQLRFMRRKGVVWPPIIHVVPTVAGPTEHIPAKRQELAMRHLSRTLRGDFEKLNDYTDNELQRRNLKDASLAAMLFKPFFRFFKTYFIKGGFRLGRVGFIQACNHAVYKYMLLAKAYEMRNTRKNS